ncbi:hypothetical protein A3K55_02395 [Candidatus Shapirobacteria bacterium RBG_13_44_7]|uniref:Uncharacterized protein n=1 Tax=Candidatus Shapirobacteria bacterium RBG_13_44_7 TaxID=1802149 RepID=A0A1F7SGJ8_9BACT|nr:MAG: hypothetical protein A3K55_02395 [Candidatus Shapirobacteria bacterium RBG_13_44_7]
MAEIVALDPNSANYGLREGERVLTSASVSKSPREKVGWRRRSRGMGPDRGLRVAVTAGELMADYRLRGSFESIRSVAAVDTNGRPIGDLRVLIVRDRAKQVG